MFSSHVQSLERDDAPPWCQSGHSFPVREVEAAFLVPARFGRAGQIAQERAQLVDRSIQERLKRCRLKPYQVLGETVEHLALQDLTLVGPPTRYTLLPGRSRDRADPSNRLGIAQIGVD